MKQDIETARRIMGESKPEVAPSGGWYYRSIQKAEPKHTPGPWEVDIAISQINPDENEYNVVFPGIDSTANGRQKTIERFVIATINGYYFGPHTNEPEANARLIAAAPDLLEALKGMLEWARRVKQLNPGMEIANASAAICKAEGRM